jgi:O-antigen/teichoic acid export membrane protein
MFALFTFAAGSDVHSGAVLTLVLPLGCVLIVLGIWIMMLRRSRGRE